MIFNLKHRDYSKIVVSIIESAVRCFLHSKVSRKKEHHVIIFGMASEN